MAVVEIEGSLTPAAGVLERGERKIVTYTEHIAQLVEYGYITIVRYIIDEKQAPAAEEPKFGFAAGGDVDKPAEVPVVNPTAEAPKGNATREEWAAFFDGLQPPVVYAPEATRDELRELWRDKLTHEE